MYGMESQKCFTELPGEESVNVTKHIGKVNIDESTNTEQTRC